MKKFSEFEKHEQETCDHKFSCIYRHPTSDLKCSRCGLVITHTEYAVWCEKNNPPLLPPTRVNTITGQSTTSTGWICPVCGAGNSPTNTTCPCKKITPLVNDKNKHTIGSPYSYLSVNGNESSNINFSNYKL